MKKNAKKAIKKFGSKAQINKTIEELKELVDVLENGAKHKGHLEEEMADVLNMIEQVQIIGNISAKRLTEIRKAKMERCLDPKYKIKKNKESILELKCASNEDGVVIAIRQNNKPVSLMELAEQAKEDHETETKSAKEFTEKILKVAFTSAVIDITNFFDEMKEEFAKRD